MPSTEQFLQEKFKEFYSKNPIDSVPAIEQREFGVGQFGKKIAARHLAFKTTESLNIYLTTTAPLYISYSPAYYQFPHRQPMQAKGFLKSDIVYEFDADDIKTFCKEEHDLWKCSKCKASGKGAIENCTSCGESTQVEEWVCPLCLEAVKKQVFSLLDIIQNDFGINEEISINYSGSKGYHIHLRSETIQNLSAKARIEMVDYITANSLELKSLGFFPDETKKFVCQSHSKTKGWAKKLLDKTTDLFKNAEETELAVAGGLTVREFKKSFPERKKAVEEFEKGRMHQLPGKKTEKFWNSMLNYSLEKLRLQIDRQTSIDISKIIRVPNTLHGSTGLIAKSFSLDRLKDFKPLDDTIAFSDATVKLKIHKTPKFYLNDQVFGPFNETETELPEFVAIYLLARGAAELV